MRHAPLVAVLAAGLGACACVDLTPPVFGGDGGASDAPMEVADGDAGDAADAPADMAGDAPPDAGTDTPPDGLPDRPDATGDLPSDLGPDAPPPPDLVGHWKLDAFATTTTTADSSMFGHTATVLGAPAVTRSNLPFPGDTGAFDFTQTTDDAIRIPDSARLRPTDQITIALWVRFATMNAHRTCGSAPSNQQYLVYRRNTRGNNQQLEGYALLRQGDNRFAFVLSTNTGIQHVVASTASSISSGIWYHLAATFDGAQMRLYVNGTLQGQPVAHTFPIDCDPAGALYLGRSGECGDPGSVTTFDGFLNGALDDVRIYDRALLGTEVSALASTGG